MLFIREWFEVPLTGWTIVGSCDIITSEDWVPSLDHRGEIVSTGPAAHITKSFSSAGYDKIVGELDFTHTASGVTHSFEFLDASGNSIVWCTFLNGVMTGRTDLGYTTEGSCTTGRYRQVIIVINKLTNIARFYLTSPTPDTDGWVQIGSEIAFSGTEITQVRLKIGGAGRFPVNQLHVYSPNYFIVGDSISAGRFLWHTDPDMNGSRGVEGTDPSSPPAYQFEQLLGGSEFVANRGFGGALAWHVNSVIKRIAIDHYAQKVLVHAGHNDIANWPTNLEGAKTAISSIVQKLHDNGITGENVTLFKVQPDVYFNTYAEEQTRYALNSWIVSKAANAGAKLALNAERLNDYTNLTPYKTLNPTYAYPDNLHLNKAGSGVLAKAAYDAKVPGGVLRAPDDRLYPASFLYAPEAESSSSYSSSSSSISYMSSSSSSSVSSSSSSSSSSAAQSSSSSSTSSSVSSSSSSSSSVSSSSSSSSNSSVSSSSDCPCAVQLAEIQATLAIIQNTSDRIAGQLFENRVEDDIVRDSAGNKISSTFYCYETAEDAAAHVAGEGGGAGLRVKYSMSFSYSAGGRMTLNKMLKVD